jgi:hypothetical protein
MKLPALLLGFASRLRFPWLFALTAVLLAVNLLLPDPVPVLDELVLALLTLLFGAWRRRPRAGDQSASSGAGERRL